MIARIDPASLPKYPDLSIEKSLWQTGLTRLGGIDEAGRGAWAGPVAAAVVILPADPAIQQVLSGVRDSKQMTSRQREAWSLRIRQVCLACGVGFASVQEIDAIGILPATRLAAWRAVQCINQPPEHLITDYLVLPDIPIPQTAFVKGDRRSLSIAAASVLAKTSRDALMRQLDDAFSGYGFGQHKGYGTRRHQAAIQKHGLSVVHRISFKIQA